MHLPYPSARLASACLLALGLAGCQTGGHGLLSCLCRQPAASQSSCGQTACGQTQCTGTNCTGTNCVESACGPSATCTNATRTTTHAHQGQCATTGGCQSSCADTAAKPAPRSCLTSLCACLRGGSAASGSNGSTSGGCTNSGCTSSGCTSGGCTSGGCTSGGCTSGGCTNGGCTSGGCTNGGCTCGHCACGSCAAVAVPVRADNCLLEADPPARQLGQPAPMAPLGPHNVAPAPPQVELKGPQELPPAAAEQPSTGAYRRDADIPPAPTGAMLQQPGTWHRAAPSAHQVTIVPAGSAASVVTIREASYPAAQPVGQPAALVAPPVIPAAPPATPVLEASLSSRSVARDAGQNLSKPWADALGLEARDSRREAPLVSENVPPFRGQSATQYATDSSRPTTSQPVLRVVDETSPFDAPARY